MENWILNHKAAAVKAMAAGGVVAWAIAATTLIAAVWR